MIESMIYCRYRYFFIYHETHRSRPISFSCLVSPSSSPILLPIIGDARKQQTPPPPSPHFQKDKIKINPKTFPKNRSHQVDGYPFGKSEGL